MPDFLRHAYGVHDPDLSQRLMTFRYGQPDSAPSCQVTTNPHVTRERRLRGIRAQMRANFPTARYRPRTLVESVFSAAKRKHSSRAPGRLPVTQRLQVLLLGLAYDIYCIRRALLLSLG